MPSFDGSEQDIEMSKIGLLKDEQLAKNGPLVKKRLRNGIVDGGCILLNIVSTVVLVFLNKWYAFL